MKATMIGTWKMCVPAFEQVKNFVDKNPDFALIRAIKHCENNPTVHTVGSYSYPNQQGFLELDSGFMNGDNLHVGAVLASRSIINPIEVAYDLSKLRNNCILTSFGADQYAKEKGYITSDHLPIHLSGSEAKQHDTVGVIVNSEGHLKVGISSSGRAGKHLGRIGDSPLVGSGFYANSQYGAAVATGNGEDILRGVLAKEIVDGLSFGLTVEDVVEIVGNRHNERLLKEYVQTSFMLLAMDRQGNFAAYTSKELFPFVTIEQQEVKLYFAQRENDRTLITLANPDLLEQYQGD